jgi:predicted phage terminase large subunit-like protein
MLPPIAEVSAERCRRSFKYFVASAWHLVCPEEIFVDGWHIDAICQYLQGLACGRIPSNNLLINIPPRHMKSLLCNVFYPAWVWTIIPSAKFLMFSYSEDLTVRDSMKCRQLIGSNWYQERFGVRINPRNDTKAQFDNMDGGYRYCFGLGGSISGQGGDFLIIDDPLEISKSNSKPVREAVNFTFDSAISTRGNDPKTVKKVIIMQRLHQDDLVGHILEKDEVWEQLILPAEYEGERFQSSIGFKDPRGVEGQLLWPQRFGDDEIAKMKSNLSSAMAAGQLQQRPAPLLGNVFKREWFEERLALPTGTIAVYQSWDTAASIEDTSAFSAGLVGYLMPDYRLFIGGLSRDRVEFPQLHYMIEKLAKPNQNQLKGIIIENKSSGIQAIQSLKQTSWVGEYVIPFNPKGEKIARAYEAARWCEKGMILLPKPDPRYPWLADFEDELFNYPNTKYKDQIDAFAQMTDYLSNYLQEGLDARSGRRN